MSVPALPIPELRTLVGELAADPRRWSHLVRHDPAQRVFEQLVDAPDVEAWLICWMPGHDTGFHDHDLSSGAVTVVSGAVCEERLGLGSAETRSRLFVPGQTFDFTASDCMGWMREAGFRETRAEHLVGPELMVVGTK